jgi:hypothetical protein
VDTGQSSLFASGIEVGMQALHRTASRPEHAALIERLIPLAQELAQRMPEGCTVADLRALCLQRGIVLPEKPHFLGAVMKAAKLVATEEWRRSDVPESHGNAQRVWRKP